MYVQKPFNIGYSFLSIFKLINLIEIFLTIRRPFRATTYVTETSRKLKSKTHRLIETGTYKLLTIRCTQHNNKLNINVNIGSRKYIFPKYMKNFQIKQLTLLFKNKIKILSYMDVLIKKIKYTDSLLFEIKKIKNKKQMQDDY